MLSPSNRTITGSKFGQPIIAAVWAKGRPVPGYDPAQYRKDSCRAWMRRASYGTTTEYGWEVDHILPTAQGGTDDISNLQPLHWRNNRRKGDDFPHWSCAVGSRS